MRAANGGDTAAYNRLLTRLAPAVRAVARREPERVAGVALVVANDGGRGVDSSEYASVGALDFSHGARAYANPGLELHLGGRTFPDGDLDYLDTEPTAPGADVTALLRGLADKRLLEL